MERPGLIQRYLRSLEAELRWRGLADARTLEEIESHLLEAVEQGLGQGLSPEQAQQGALERFGPARLVARQFEKERNSPMQKIYPWLALGAGLLIAYVDSLPHWDDTGITVFALLLSSGLFGLLAQRRPWLIALAVGLWIPLRAIVLSQNFSMLFVMLFPLLGAYAGWGLGRIIRRTQHPA